MENYNVNVQEIMDKIKSEIEAENLSSDILSFEDFFASSNAPMLNFSFNEKAFSNEIRILNAAHTIASDREVTGNGLVRFIKKVVRKLSRFYIEPIVKDQNAFNSHTIRALNGVRRYILDTDAKQKNLVDIQIWYTQKARPALDSLSQTITDLSSENARLSEKVENLESELLMKDKLIEKNTLELELLRSKVEKLIESEK